MNIIDSLHPFREGVLASGQWLRLVNVLCLTGAVVALLTSVLRLRGGTDETGTRRTPALARLLLPLTIAAIGVGFTSIWHRYLEVNHFPSQTMGEVLVMAGWFSLVSLFVLVVALGLEKMGSSWVLLQDALYMTVFLGAWMINLYSTSLSTAQRDLPPALQSYWFPPHLAALIFSYVTLSIAGVIGIKYFCIRFWSGVFSGGRPLGSQLLLLGALTLVPFVQVVTIPILAVVGLAFLGMKLARRLPSAETVRGIEKPMDVVSYRAFCVGIPFLTAGLFMGAFWAQDAWATTGAGTARRTPR